MAMEKIIDIRHDKVLFREVISGKTYFFLESAIGLRTFDSLELAREVFNA